MAAVEQLKQVEMHCVNRQSCQGLRFVQRNSHKVLAWEFFLPLIDGGLIKYVFWYEQAFILGIPLTFSIPTLTLETPISNTGFPFTDDYSFVSFTYNHFLAGIMCDMRPFNRESPVEKTRLLCLSTLTDPANISISSLVALSEALKPTMNLNITDLLLSMISEFFLIIRSFYIFQFLPNNSVLLVITDLVSLLNL